MTGTPGLSIYEKPFVQSDKTDVILVIKGKKWHVNKAVLSFHSVYFKALFQSESENAEYPIEYDVTFENVSTVLSLILSAPIKFNMDQVYNLLGLAKEFQLPAAKRHVELFLMSRDSPSEEKLKIADKYDMKELLVQSVSGYKTRDDYGKITKAEQYIFRRGFTTTATYSPHFNLFDTLSDETNVKLFHRLLQIDSKISDGPEKTKNAEIYEKTFAKSDKTDAILVVEGKKLYVNKEALSYYSDYFQALFNSDFKEKSMAEIPIQDVKFEDFATLLSLLHPNPIMPTDENAEKLLELAERFLISSHVNRHLELFLLSSSVDFLNKIRIAEKYQLEDLLEYGITLFTSSDFQDIDKSNVYQGLSASTKNKLFYKYLKNI